MTISLESMLDKSKRRPVAGQRSSGFTNVARGRVYDNKKCSSLIDLWENMITITASLSPSAIAASLKPPPPKDSWKPLEKDVNIPYLTSSLHQASCKKDV